MKLLHHSFKSYLAILLLSVFCFNIVNADYSPKISSKDFSSPPKQIIYFEDTSNVLYLDDPKGLVYFSQNDGESWEKLNFDNEVIKLILVHPYKKNIVYAFSDSKYQFRSISAGKVWKKIETPESVHISDNFFQSPSIVFHGKRQDYALFAGQCIDDNSDKKEKEKEKNNNFCSRKFYYTRDGFLTFKELTTAHTCIFTEATNLINAEDQKSVICSSIYDNKHGLSLAKSLDWFQDDITHINAEGGVLITGIELLTSVDHYLIAIGHNILTTDKETENLFIYISYDGKAWKEISLPENVNFRSNSFSILKSFVNSLHIDLKINGIDNLGQLFSANLDTGYFNKILDYTNRDPAGNVDYETLTSIDGIILSNQVSNGQSIILDDSLSPTVRSKISFDNGNSWTFLKLSDSDDDSQSCRGDTSCSLNLHSIVERADNFKPNNMIGKYYSSPVPGLLLGVGNIGSSLKDYDYSDTYMSNDAGLSWAKTLNGPYLFEFGDSGSVIVAISDSIETNSIKYSRNMGKTWKQVSIKDSIYAKVLTTTPDSTSSKFLIIGKTSNGKYKSISLNFDKLFDRKCVENDMEDWYVPSVNGQSMCFMGYKQKFSRKKSESYCYVGKLYNEAEVVQESCPCVELDYECAYDFSKDNESGKCVPNDSLYFESIKSKECDGRTEIYSLPPSYRKIPGNQCSSIKGLNLDSDVVKRCPNYEIDMNNKNGAPKDINHDVAEGDKQEATDSMNNGKIKSLNFQFSGTIKDYIYLERDVSKDNQDETIVLLTSENEAYVTHDQGASWEQIAPGEEIISFKLNPYNSDHVFLLTTNQKIIYSMDRADNWKSFRTPSIDIPGTFPISFHPKKPSWLVWTGQTGCENANSLTCQTNSYVSRSYGKRWEILKKGVERCSFIQNLNLPTSDMLIYCIKKGNNDQNKELIASTDFFKYNQVSLVKNLIDYSIVDGFVFAAAEGKKDDDEIRAFVSMDGETFAETFFPHNVDMNKQKTYTLLGAKSKAISLHVTTNSREGAEFGTLLKSNSNGTYFIVSQNYVNRNSAGYVDFEQISSLEGVVVVNVVANYKEARKGAKKSLKSMISHTDGAQWSYIQPPSVDSENKKYKCAGQPLEKCSLHLHGFTERRDYRDTFSSTSATGVMIGVGNVGDSLDSFYEGNTFITKDGGVTWKEIKKGVYQWEYGDQGTIIALVAEQDNTNVIYYTIDEGDTWNSYEFTTEKVVVNDIATVPLDNSRKFLLFTTMPTSRGERSQVFQIDFTNLLKRKCSLDLRNPDDDDFELWSPKHPFSSSNCLFGHETQYYRKLPNKECYIGDSIADPYVIVKNCTCTRQDYECDFNYYRDEHGECRLITGYSPPDHSQYCKQNRDAIEYWVPTGYRRIPLTTCQGGNEFDKVDPMPCPGREEAFASIYERGLQGLKLILLIAAILVGSFIVFYITYRYYYYARYGQIRLDENNEFTFTDDTLVNKASKALHVIMVKATIQLNSGYDYSKVYLDTIRERLYGKKMWSFDRFALKKDRNHRYTSVDEENTSSVIFEGGSSENLLGASDEVASISPFTDLEGDNTYKDDRDAKKEKGKSMSFQDDLITDQSKDNLPGPSTDKLI
ncbi:vacuolar protein sorting/targeting protein 10 [Ascoidea rubescens DSM 1968]|uniref:Oligoxyloglucan reducing end-specific cellobiohydrolase n=1 Tax=Ascoidea rubescens DSM 1968 TaxID=1344418 RepID=A0A1D2VP54_9ASCO|nr:Oligoxyloglucan reducing end-specific cellobiohydrolase [Ascoidea rubescens DSM 1968]ODV63374.1 Oligoxyloglucan reducing end-specific cellobiohydrolase [Ascoidea rubescens DSM 1968]